MAKTKADELRTKWTEANRERITKFRSLQDLPPSDRDFVAERAEKDYRNTVQQIRAELDKTVARALDDVAKSGVEDPATRLFSDQLRRANELYPMVMGDFQSLPQQVLVERVRLVAKEGDPATRVAYYKAGQRALNERWSGPGKGIALQHALSALENTVVNTELRDRAIAEIEAADLLNISIAGANYRERRRLQQLEGQAEIERNQAARDLAGLGLLD